VTFATSLLSQRRWHCVAPFCLRRHQNNIVLWQHASKAPQLILYPLSLRCYRAILYAQMRRRKRDDHNHNPRQVHLQPPELEANQSLRSMLSWATHLSTVSAILASLSDEETVAINITDLIQPDCKHVLRNSLTRIESSRNAGRVLRGTLYNSGLDVGPRHGRLPSLAARGRSVNHPFFAIFGQKRIST